GDGDQAGQRRGGLAPRQGFRRRALLRLAGREPRRRRPEARDAAQPLTGVLTPAPAPAAPPSAGRRTAGGAAWRTRSRCAGADRTTARARRRASRRRTVRA